MELCCLPTILFGTYNNIKWQPRTLCNPKFWNSLSPQKKSHGGLTKFIALSSLARICNARRFHDVSNIVRLSIPCAKWLNIVKPSWPLVLLQLSEGSHGVTWDDIFDVLHGRSQALQQNPACPSDRSLGCRYCSNFESGLSHQSTHTYIYIYIHIYVYVYDSMDVWMPVSM